MSVFLRSSGREAAGPPTGGSRCRFMAAPVLAARALSEAMIDKSRPRLLFFYSPRSGRCRRAESFLAEVLQQRRNHDTFVITRVAVETHPELVQRLRIETVPTFLVVD